MAIRLLCLVTLAAVLVGCDGEQTPGVEVATPVSAATADPTPEPTQRFAYLWPGGPGVELPPGFKVLAVHEYEGDCWAPSCEEGTTDCEPVCEYETVVRFEKGCSIRIQT